MTTLMVYAGTAADDAEVTRTGGIPLVPAVFTAANFGGDCGHGLACQPCRTAAFLWQQ
jgi:hypothetical protein